MQYSKKLSKNDRPQMKNKLFFVLGKEKVRFQELVVRKRVPLHLFVLQISVLNFIPHNICFLTEIYPREMTLPYPTSLIV